ncbi:zinc-finger domain-containing protein [bacterium 1xD8-6]|nr:zinc-finger domain-containing protein [bacterium D16-36]RKI66852.1 zinc-finger domain-containing protein [bacterium 1xD8-6]
MFVTALQEQSIEKEFCKICQIVSSSPKKHSTRDALSFCILVYRYVMITFL